MYAPPADRNSTSVRLPRLTRREVGQGRNNELMSLARVSSPRFIGRNAELGHLLVALDDAGAGRCVPVLVTGEAGVGKTRLVSKFLAAAAGSGARVATGGATGFGEGGLPYAPIVEVLRSIVRSLGRGAFRDLLPAYAQDKLALLLPELFDAPPSLDLETSPGAPPALYAAVLTLVEELAAEAPQVICLEDLHWADRSTQDMIAFLVRNLHQAPVVFVLTYRDDEVRHDHALMPFLVELQRNPSHVRLELSPLGREEVAAQIEAIGDTVAETEVVDRVYLRSEGNPLLVEELLAAHLAGTSLPQTLKEALLMRMAHLSPAARALLRASAAIGRRVSASVLESITTLTPPEVEDALQECVAQRILIPQSDDATYWFRHGLLQEVIYAEVLPGERRRLHGLIADRLAETVPAEGTDRAVVLAQIARHRHASGDVRATLHSSLAAARAAESSFALAEAAQHYERALEGWEGLAETERPDSLPLPDVLQAAAKARWSGLGDAVGATRLLQRALDLRSAEVDPAGRADIMSYLASLQWEATGVSAHVLDTYEQALQLVPLDAVIIRVRILARYARALMLASRFTQAKALAEEAIEAAGPTDARRDVADALMTLLATAGALGHMDLAFDTMERARSEAMELRDPHLLGRFFSNATYLLHMAGRYEEVYETALEGVAALRAAGVSYDTQLFVRSNAAEALVVLGRLTDAEELLGHESPPAPLTASLLQVQRAYLQRTRGNFPSALAHLDAARNIGASVKELQLQLVIECLSADIAAWRGEIPIALSAIDAGYSALVETDETILAARLASIAARVAADAGANGSDAEERAVLLLGLAQRLLDENSYPWPEAVAFTFQARAELDRIGGPPHPELWDQVAVRWSDLKRPYESAYALWRQAESFTADAERVELEQVLEEARSHASRCEAAHLLAAIDTFVASSGLGGSAQTRDAREDPDDPLRRIDAEGDRQGGAPLTLEQEGDYWTVRTADRAVRIKDMRGLHYLATLVANPGTEFRALDLVAAGAPMRSRRDSKEQELSVESQEGVAVLDERAKREYRKRIADLEAEIEDADEANDVGRAERARVELDFLVAELSRALGLAGRDRMSGSPIERARLSVTKAIRRVVERIDKADPDLGAYLTQSVRTGRICVYTPPRYLS